MRYYFFSFSVCCTSNNNEYCRRTKEHQKPLLIQCAKESHEKNLLQMKTFCGLKCSVTPHSSLNTSKGIIRCPALSRVTGDDIKEGMAEQGVTDVRRITVRRDGVIKPTYTYVLRFN